MMKLNRGQFLLLTSLFSLILAACSTTPKTTVIPRVNGDYVVISTSHNEARAIDAAVQDGNRYCGTKGKDFVALDPEPPTQGMDKQARDAIGIAGAVIGTVTGNKSALTQKAKNMPYTRDGDQVAMSFRCK